LLIGIGGYLLVVCFLIISLQGSTTILMVNGAWDGISAAIESIAAYIFLGERFHDYYCRYFFTPFNISNADFQ
jgi:hypothetical protein